MAEQTHDGCVFIGSVNLDRAPRAPNKKSAPSVGPYKTPKAGSSTASVRSSLCFLNQGERDRHLHHDMVPLEDVMPDAAPGFVVPLHLRLSD